MANCKDCLHQCYTEATEEACNFFVDITKYVEVARCDKCLHWDDHNNGYGYCKHPHWRYAGEYDALTEHCDFCSYGERREVE